MFLLVPFSHCSSSNVMDFLCCLATTIAVLMSVSCQYMASFTYGRKKAKGLSITCRCHLSNIMPDQYYASIFYDSMVSGLTRLLLLLFLLKGCNCCLPHHRRDGCNLIMQHIDHIDATPMGVWKP